MVKVLVVGQTPPPYGGQAMMIHRLVTSELDGVEIVDERKAGRRFTIPVSNK